MATKKEIEIKLKSTLDGKGVEEAKQKIDSLNKSTENLEKGGKQAAQSVKNLGRGALQAAYFFDDLQYGIRGIMNNIPSLVMGFGGGAGLAGALSLAVLAGTKLYEWLGKTNDKSEELAKSLEKRNEEIKDFENLIASFNNEDVLKKYDEYTARIASNRKKEAETLKESVREQQRLLDLQSKILDNQDQADLLKLETDYYSGEFGDPSTSSARFLFEGKQENIRLNARARHRQEKEESAKINVSNAERELTEKNENVSLNETSLLKLQAKNIFSYHEFENLNKKILDTEKQIFDNLLSISETVVNNEEENGFLWTGTVSTSDKKKWIQKIIENGGKTSELENTLLQKINTYRLPNFRSAPELMEDVLTTGNAKIKLDYLNILRNQRTASNNALAEEGYDISTEEALKDAYKKRDEEVQQAQESLKKLIEEQNEAERSLNTNTQQLAEIRQINASEEKIDEEQRKKNEAKEQYRRSVEAEKENEKAVKDEIAAKKEYISELKKQAASLKKEMSSTKDKRDKTIENIDLTNFSKSLANSSPTRKNNANEAYNDIIKAVKEAFEDNDVSQKEMQSLARQLLTSLSQKGEIVSFSQSLSLIKRIVSVVETTNSKMKQYESELQSITQKFSQVEKQMNNMKTGLNRLAR